MSRKYDGVSFVLGGAAGQGIQTIEAILTNVLHKDGFFVSSTKEFMSRIRGGSNSTEIRVTRAPREGYVGNIDVCLPLDLSALTHLEKRITTHTKILGDTEKLKGTRHDIIDIPLSRLAAELGNPLFANTIAAGVVVGLLDVRWETLREYVEGVFAKKGNEVVEKNVEAAKQGFNIGKHMNYMQSLHIATLSHENELKSSQLISGNDAFGWGLLRGGINFVASYPMTPGTAILTFFAQQAEPFGLAVEQTEDEIAAINMGLGAAYAGARSLVTTSGGGFALMVESVSLSGMIETPIVIHIAMRPGPATGLPTRTEQGDFNLALYAGHGEFPRAIYAPGDAEEAFEVGQEAVRIADKYQSPIFVLTDQFFLDKVTGIDDGKIEMINWEPTIVETEKDYRRYMLTDDGISPRGVPGWGEGLVVVDSDEHTEDGHLTEDMDMRVKMIDKRLRKLEGMRSEVLPPVVIGSEDAEIVIVGWGSTKPMLTEALEFSKRDDIRYIHFKQIWPLPKDVKKLFKGAKKIFVIENSAAGQFAAQLKLAGVKVTDSILKYTGEPFSVEEIAEKLSHI